MKKPQSIFYLPYQKRIFRLLLFISLIIWCAGFSSQSIFPGSDAAYVFHPVLKKFYGMVCHQKDYKTIAIMNHKLLVCARCTGIYLGALTMSFLSTFFLPKVKVPLALLCAASLPMLLDVIFTTINLYKYFIPLALLTGLFFGSAVFLYILSVVENNFIETSSGNNE